MTEIEKLKLFKEKGFTYNPETGEIFSPTGKLQKTTDKYGYIICGLSSGYKVKSHRLAWFLHYGTIDDQLIIDHINHITIDNRIENLRLVSKNQNMWNRKCIKGCSNQNDRYKSRIRIYNKLIHLGHFDTEQEAHQAYLEAKKKYHVIE